MRKALLPMLASLLICGTATAALIATNANADQTARKPVMMMLAQNQAATPPALDGAPPPGMGPGMAPGMDRRMMRGPRRGEMCKNMYAGKAGEMAFLEAKLQLTAGQQPLFARWKDISLDIAKRHESDCSAKVDRMRSGQRGDTMRGDMMQGLTREEDRLKTRLADIQAVRPSLTALYAALNPAQKEELSRAARRDMGGRMHMAMGMMHPGMGHGMGPGMGHGPEMGRRFGRGPDGQPPAPLPPAQ